jgi:hypothetical protein
MVLFVPLLVGLNAHLGALNGDAGWCFPATTRGWLKLGHLSASGVRGGDVAPSFMVLLGASVDTWRGRDYVSP